MEQKKSKANMISEQDEEKLQSAGKKAFLEKDTHTVNKKKHSWKTKGQFQETKGHFSKKTGNSGKKGNSGK